MKKYKRVFKEGKIATVMQHVLDEMNGVEVLSQNYEGVVGVKKNEVIQDGKVIDRLDSNKKIKQLWLEYLESEGIT